MGLNNNLGKLTEVLTVSGSNIGVGTTTPSTKLDISGSISADYALSIQSTDPGNPTSSIDELRVSGYGIMGNRGGLYITNASSTGNIQFGIGGTHAESPKMYISASGNVGIGLTNPSYILQTKASSGFVGAAFSSYYSSTAIIGTDNNGVWFGQGTNGLGVAYVVNNTSGFAQIEVGGSPRFFVNSSGNVGIGNTTPNAPLDVTSATTNTSNIQQWSYNGSPSSYRLQLNTIVSSGLVKYSFDMLNAGASYNNSLVFDRGSIGIGTAAPDNGKLTILKNTSNATESSYGIAIQSNATNAYTELLIGADDTVDCGVVQTAGKNTSFTTKKLAFQPNGGNVGIGTTGPTDQLHLSRGGSTYIAIDNTGSNYKTLVGSTGSGTKIYSRVLSTNAAAPIAFVQGADENVTITSGGNMLVGTQSDTGQRLQVNGKIKTTQSTANNSILMKQTTIGANSTTDVFFDVSSELGIPSNGYIMVEISAIGYGNSGGNGMNYMGIVGGYSGHTINSAYHRSTTYVNTITNGSVSTYNPYNNIYGITITNSAGTGMIVLLKLNITWY